MIIDVNPHRLLRKDQSVNEFVWYASYDEDMLNEQMLLKIGRCSDPTLPLEFQSLKIQQYEIVFQEPGIVYLQRKFVRT